MVEQGTNYGPSNGYGSTWRFDRPGGAYGDIDLRVGNQTFDVPRETENYFTLNAANPSRKPLGSQPANTAQETQQPVNLLSLREQTGGSNSSRSGALRGLGTGALLANGNPMGIAIGGAVGALSPVLHRLMGNETANDMFNHWYDNATPTFGGPEYIYQRPNYDKPTNDGTWAAVETPSTRDLAAMNVGYTQNRGQAGLRDSGNLLAPKDPKPYEVFNHNGGNFVYVAEDSPLNRAGRGEGISVNEFSRRTGAFNHTQRVKAEEDRGR